MARKDLVAGLRNAIERGYSLEEAKHSFISAGYNREDIEEAANFVNSGSSLIQGEEKPLVKPVMSVQPAKPSKQGVEKSPTSNKGSIIDNAKKNSKVILLTIILALLIIAFILTFLFRDKILNLFT